MSFVPTRICTTANSAPDLVRFPVQTPQSLGSKRVLYGGVWHCHLQFPLPKGWLCYQKVSNRASFATSTHAPPPKAFVGFHSPVATVTLPRVAAGSGNR